MATSLTFVSILKPERRKNPVMNQPVIALLLATLLALGGCNTVQGLGQDIQKGGQALEDAAKRR